MGRTLAALALALALPGCDPLGVAVLEGLIDPKKTENFRLRNDPDDFYRKADHHDFKATETYDWHNCGEQAMVDVEVTPSCPNDATIDLYDAEGTLVFQQTFHAPHCWRGKRDWDPIPTAAGVPGTWRIVLTFDITGVRDLEIHITRLGAELVTVTTGVTHEKQWLRWAAACTNDRDVAETHALNVGCTKVRVTASWQDFTAGSIEVTVTDGAGLFVYHATFAPGMTSPRADVSATGTSGVWHVTILSSDLTGTLFQVLVEEL